MSRFGILSGPFVGGQFRSQIYLNNYGVWFAQPATASSLFSAFDGRIRGHGDSGRCPLWERG